MRATSVVHLELHTGDLAEASSFYAELCGWRSQRIETAAGSYHAVSLGGGIGSGIGGGIGGGIVECPAPRAIWLPYAEVERIDRTTERARELGARVLLEPREGPAGWRSVVATPAAGEIALWQPKR